MTRNGCHKREYIDTKTLEKSHLLVFTYFSASMDLRAGELDNSSVGRHAVFAIYIVLHSKRVVTVDKDGELVEHTRAIFGISLEKPCQKARRAITSSTTHA
jgi:hypothetical protein